jgi:hypothetical protein
MTPARLVDGEPGFPSLMVSGGLHRRAAKVFRHIEDTAYEPV